MLDIWVILWVVVCLTVLVSVLESISRRAKERRRLMEEQEMQHRLNMQQFHVLTLQPFGSSSSSSASILSIQQQQQLHRLQELKACQDLPPKYEDVVLNLPPVITVANNSAPSASQNTPIERY